MKTYHIDPARPSFRQLREVVDKVVAGAVMVYPTDTIYGLGCDIFQTDSIRRIATIKKRDADKPFSFVCESVAQISQFAFVSNWAYKLMNRLLPGPYTFILEARRTNIPKKMLGRRNTVGVRVPDHPVCQRIVKLTGRPILSTSVNLAGGEPLTDPVMLPDEFSTRIDVIVSVGPLVSDPSTVIDLTGGEPVLIREGKGAIPW